MQRKKVVFLGSKPVGYQCFSYLISQKDALNIDIIGLQTKARKEFGNTHDLNILAEEHNIPIIDELSKMPECDILYSVQYHQILKETDIKKAKQAAVNLHMAPLPEYRGSNQFSYAIIDGKEEFGTTIHLIDTKIDHGDILFQKRFPIPVNCWVEELYKLTLEASIKIFQQTISHIVNGIYSAVPQASLEHKYGSTLHYRNEINKLKHIDMGMGREMVERYIRATAMPGFDPPYCLIDGQKVYFTTQRP